MKDLLSGGWHVRQRRSARVIKTGRETSMLQRRADTERNRKAPCGVKQCPYMREGGGEGEVGGKKSRWNIGHEERKPTAQVNTA